MQVRAEAMTSAGAVLEKARRWPWDLALGSAIAVLFLAARMAHARTPLFGFLAYNLVLAWIPFVSSTLLAERRIARHALGGWLRIPLFVLWLAFFPNAPYLVTDLVHLRPRAGTPHWYDVAMFSAFAWCGMVLALRSLGTMGNLVRERLGSAFAWVFVTVVCGLTGVGIYLGRFLRLNSWELFTDPGYVLVTLRRVGDAPLQALGVSLAFGALVWMGYVTLGGRPGRGVPPPQ